MNPYLSTLIAVFELVALAVFAMYWPGAGSKWLGRLECFLARWAQSRAVIPAVAAGVFLCSAGLQWSLKLPEPAIHDEFAYLLQADTFAQGRLANPTHPMAQHFEQFHVIFEPAYAAKYPPGQGLFLALGQILGAPIMGVWISTALAGAALFWMLSGLFPKKWALAGTVLALFNPQVLTWNWSFWGGSVALCGGALTLGGFVRLWKTGTSFPAMMLGAGLGILSLSRPYEGAMLGLMLAVVWFARAWRQGPGGLLFFRRIIGPMSSTLLPLVLFHAWYNYRVTGSPWKMPYLIYEEKYSARPSFIWQTPHPKNIEYHNPQMARMYAEWSNPFFDRQRTMPGFGQVLVEKLIGFKKLVWNGLLLVVVVPLGFLLRKRSGRLLAGLLLGALIVSLVGPVWSAPHYFAPYYPLLVALLIGGLREMRTWQWRQRRAGRWLVPGVLVVLCFYGYRRFYEEALARETKWPFKRGALLSRLESDGKKHLVLVQYGPKHNFHEAWVWNRADINRAQVVWATDLGENRNGELFSYFKGYEIDRVEPDRKAEQGEVALEVVARGEKNLQ